MATTYDADYMRSAHGQRPQIMVDVEKLQKLVGDLRCKLVEQEDELQRTKTDVAGLKRVLDKTTVLAESQTCMSYKDPESSSETSAPVALGPTKATLTEAADSGRWVIHHGQCWRRTGTNGLELVSDLEMKVVKGVTWEDLRGLPDPELLLRYSIVRGGSHAVSGYEAKQLVPPTKMKEAEEKFITATFFTMVTAAKELRPSKDDTGDDLEDEGDDVDSDDDDDEDEGDDSDDDAGDDSDDDDGDDSDKEPDLRRRPRRLSSSGATPGRKVRVSEVRCVENHATRLNRSNGERVSTVCGEDVPQDQRFWRCKPCDWNACQDCCERQSQRQ
jgi:hypothetical protein